MATKVLDRDIELLNEFRKTLELNAQELQKYGVATHYEEHLKEPEVEELPQMLQVDVETFYKGLNQKESEYEPLRSFAKQKKEASGKFITMKDIFEKKLGEKEFTMIIGPAGSGKTTILTRFTRDAMNRRIKQDEDCLIHIVNCRRFCGDDQIDVKEFLFRDMMHRPSDEAIDVGLKWMSSHPEKVTFVIDSLDTLPYELNDKHAVAKPTSRVSPSFILSNIFNGRLFPGSHVLSSSREHKIRKFQYEIRPNQLIQLMGLTQESIQRLIMGFLGKTEGERLLEYLQKCPDLMLLCETPVFLVFTLIGLQRKNEASNFLPSTMSGVMINLLQSLLRSQHATALSHQDNEEIVKIINKLKQLSFLGTKEGKVIFQEEDLSKVDLRLEDITDLVIVIPGPSTQQQRLLEGSSVLFFAHQSIQEMLCAMYIAEMHENQFKEFVTSNIHKSQYSVIRRMLCGILLNRGVHDQASMELLKVHNDTEINREFIMESMREEAGRRLKQTDLLELFHALHEAGNAKEIFSSNVHEMDFSYTALTPADMYAIASGLQHITAISKLDMFGCYLTPESLQLLSDGLKDSTVEIRVLNVGGNKNMEEDGLTAIGNLVRRCKVEELNMYACNLQSSEVQTFIKTLGDAKIRVLNVGSNGNMEEDGLAGIGSLVRRCKVEELNMSVCNLSSSEVQIFSKALGDAKIRVLNVSRNENMEEDGLTAIGSLVRRCKVEELEMSDCNLQSSEVQAFNRAFGDARMMMLDISGDLFEEPYFIESVCQLLPKVKKELNLTEYQITKEDVDLLQMKLDGLYPTELQVKIGEYHDPTKLTSQMMDSMEQEDLIIVSKSKTFEVDQNEETFEIGGCVITFPENAFDGAAIVHVKVEIDSSKWPKGYIGITPMLYIEADRKLLQPVSVMMTSWCAKNVEEESSAEVHVLHLPDVSSDWEVISTLPFQDGNVFEFECIDFSPILIAIWEAAFGRNWLLVDVILVGDKENNFTLNFHPINKVLGHGQDDHIIPFNTIKIHIGDQIDGNIVCEGDGFDFLPDRFNFLIDGDFIRMKQKSINQKFLLRHEGRGSRRILSRINIRKNEQFVEENVAFFCRWRGEQEQPRRVDHANVVIDKVGELNLRQ